MAIRTVTTQFDDGKNGGNGGNGGSGAGGGESKGNGRTPDKKSGDGGGGVGVGVGNGIGTDEPKFRLGLRTLVEFAVAVVTVGGAFLVLRGDVEGLKREVSQQQAQREEAIRKVTALEIKVDYLMDEVRYLVREQSRQQKQDIDRDKENRR